MSASQKLNQYRSQCKNIGWRISFRWPKFRFFERDRQGPCRESRFGFQSGWLVSGRIGISAVVSSDRTITALNNYANDTSSSKESCVYLSKSLPFKANEILLDSV